MWHWYLLYDTHWLFLVEYSLGMIKARCWSNIWNGSSFYSCQNSKIQPLAMMTHVNLIWHSYLIYYIQRIFLDKYSLIISKTICLSNLWKVLRCYSLTRHKFPAFCLMMTHVSPRRPMLIWYGINTFYMIPNGYFWSNTH